MRIKERHLEALRRLDYSVEWTQHVLNPALTGIFDVFLDRRVTPALVQLMKETVGSALSDRIFKMFRIASPKCFGSLSSDEISSSSG